VWNYPSYSRYEHSIGVLFLVREQGASMEEQIAALTHDASHTCFSHTGGFAFRQDAMEIDAYQDDIHSWFLQQTEVPFILSKYALSIDDIHHKNKHFLCLEQNLPNICADRLEYTLYGGYLEKILSLDDIQTIRSHLHFEFGLWFFDDVLSARTFGYTSLYLTKHLFASSHNWVLNTLMGAMLRRALDINLISFDDIHFGTDELIWDRLSGSSDTCIKRLMSIAFTSTSSFIQVEQSMGHDVCIYQKFRGIDPFVKTDEGLFRLTELDQEFAQDYTILKKKLEKGICLQLKFSL
jgi:hypothetical protein